MPGMKSKFVGKPMVVLLLLCIQFISSQCFPGYVSGRYVLYTGKYLVLRHSAEINGPIISEDIG